MPHKPKLLFVWSELGKNGSDLALVNLVIKLKEYYCIYILCLSQINIFDLPNDIQITFICKPSNTKIGRLFNKLIFFCKWLKIAKNYQLHIVDEVPMSAIMSFLISLITNTKYFIWVHNCKSEMIKYDFKVLKPLYKKSLLYAKAVIFVSQYSATSMYNYLQISLNNISIIYNILSLQSLKKNNHNQSQIVTNININNHDQITICAVGRLVSEKNFSLLLYAIAKILPMTTKLIHLYICGDGYELSLLQQLTKTLNLTNYVTFTGYVNDVMPYINICDIFVSSSNSESFSIAVCEALYCNKAVIVTNTGAQEIIENGKYGIMIARNGVTALTNALLLLINDDNLRQKYANNAKFALDKFDTMIAINQWHSLIKQQYL